MVLTQFHIIETESSTFLCYFVELSVPFFSRISKNEVEQAGECPKSDVETGGNPQKEKKMVVIWEYCMFRQSLNSLAIGGTIRRTGALDRSAASWQLSGRECKGQNLAMSSVYH